MKTLDTRDLYKRQNELESLRDAITEAREALDAHKATPRPEDPEDAEEWDSIEEDLERDVVLCDCFGDEEREELEEIIEVENCAADFMHGETMVPVDDFEEYAEELASDTCDMKEASGWPFRHIDWKAAAEELAQDYKEVTYQGTAYYVRS